MNTAWECNEYNTEPSRASAKVRTYVSACGGSKNENSNGEKPVADDQCHESLLDIHGLLEIVSIIKGITGAALPPMLENPIDPTWESAQVRMSRGR